MARNSSGAVRPGRRSFAIHGGTPRITESSAPSSCCVRSKSSATARSPSKRIARRRSPNRTGDPRAARKASAGSMKLCASPWAGEQRVAGLSPRGESLAQQSRGERGRAFRRIGVERRGQQGAPEPLVKRSLAVHGVADRRAPSLHEHAERSEIFAERRARHAFLRIEQPPRDTAFAEIEPPALAALEVREVEDRGARIVQRLARADPIEIVQRLVIA